MTPTAEREHRFQTEDAVDGLRQAALDAGVELPPGYAEPSGQWYGDGTRYGSEAPHVARPAAVREARG